jgi:site-specific DNA-methyltransferase (adenine-specific)
MLELNKIYLGMWHNYIKDIPENYIDLILVDPPYNIDNQGKVKSHLSTTGIVNINYNFEKCNINDFLLFIPKLKETGSIVIFYDARYNYKIIDLFENNNLKFKSFIYYIKNNRGINPRKNFVNIIETACWFVKNSDYKWNGKGTSRNGIKDFTNELNNPKKCIHPTQKPLNVFKEIIRIFTDKNDIVADFYSGSGTTAHACINLYRNFICFEKEEKYYNTSIKRIEIANKIKIKKFIE